MVFHKGELAVQSRMGVRKDVARWADRAIRRQMTTRQQEMFSKLPYVFVAGRDDQRRIWATLLTGSHGFIRPRSDTILEIAASPIDGDALQHEFSPSSEIGLLGIDLESRRRNRVNGIVTDLKGGLSIDVRQAYGNCPQFIVPRHWSFSTHQQVSPTAILHKDYLTSAMAEFIQNADTFFIASGYHHPHDPQSGLDISHRGGKAGMVEVVNERELLFPDYAGNNYFNTIGNLVMDPAVGLLFVDFANGGVLQLSGQATIDWNSPAVVLRAGAQRLVQVQLEKVIWREKLLPFTWGKA